MARHVGFGIAVALAALALSAIAAPAQAQQASPYPDWARVLIAADMHPAAGTADPLPAPAGGIAARLTIIPVEGGVGRLIRYTSSPAEPGRLALVRFTGHPRTGWSQWGGDFAVRSKLEAPANLDQALRTAMRAFVSGEPRQSGGACASGSFAYLEIADGSARTGYERRCVEEGAAAAAIRALSAAAGSEDEEALHAAGLKELMDADRAFNTMAQEKGVPAAFVEFAHEDVVLFYPGREPYRGKSGVRERFARWPAGAKLIWAPAGAEISARGDMGWTWGRGDFVTADAKRTPSQYLSVWRRDFDGVWRYVSDMGIDGVPAPGAATPTAPSPTTPPVATPAPATRGTLPPPVSPPASPSAPGIRPGRP